MIKRLGIALQVILGLVTLPLFSFLLHELIKIEVNELPPVNILSTVGVGMGIMFLVRKKKFYLVPLVGTWVFALFLLIPKFINKHQEYHQLTSIESNWKEKTNELTIPFYVAPSGHIFLEANINGYDGYMGFDTGSEITGIRENSDNPITRFSMTITDSNGISKNMNISRLDSLSLGNLQIHKVSYISMPNAVWEKCGLFFNQDSIIGILGNNIINHFVWDFDLINQKVGIRKKLPKLEVSNIETINLSNTGNNSWLIDLAVNGVNKEVILDTGSDTFLTLKDSLNTPNTYQYYSKHYSQSRGLYSYVDCTGKAIRLDTSIRKQRKVFGHIQFSNSLIRNVYINDQKASNSIGIPLIWEYEQVVLDFLNGKIFLVKRTDSESPYGFTQKSLRQIHRMKMDLMNSQGYFESNNNDTLTISGVQPFKNDTITYNFVGLTKTFGHLENSNHVIIDSILNIPGGITVRTDEFVLLNYDFFNEL